MPDSDANEPSKADLERRVDQLEATVQKMMPTRRGVLTGLAGAGIGGAAVYGASENARAQAAGQVGTGTNPVDVEAWNLNVANQVTSDLAIGGNDVTGVGAMDVEQMGPERHYAGAYEGADADARLDAVLSAATDGDVVYLESLGSSAYTDSRTISTKLRFIGTNPGSDSIYGTTINGTWTIDDRCTLSAINFWDGSAETTLTVASDRCQLDKITLASITVSQNSVIITSARGGSVTFDSGSEDGIVDSSSGVIVTDNGSNTVGDIA